MECEKDHLKGKSKTIFTKIIVEMKNTFNKNDTITESATEDSDSDLRGFKTEEYKQNGLPTNDLDDISTVPVNNFIEIIKDRQPIKVIEESEDIIDVIPAPKKDSIVMDKPTKIKSTHRRSLRRKVQEETVLKRSARRRKSNDCESVLQSAIARKEKSYNESNKPQRLTRQLKLTPKILENLAQSPVKDRNKSNRIHDKRTAVDSGKGGKHKLSAEVPTKRIKRIKSNADVEENIEIKVDVRSIDIETNDDQFVRRSHRKSISQTKDEDCQLEADSPEPRIPEHDLIYPADPECSSVGAELIASKMCFCTKSSNMYLNCDKKHVFCQAIDDVCGKFVGCNKLVNPKDFPLTRPSYRVPYGVLCQIHANRMLRHNRCPTCGTFCTQGNFVECENGHHYHRKCQISVGDIQCCPHCSSLTPRKDVFLTMYLPGKPLFLVKQNPTYPPAKMSFAKKFVTYPSRSEKLKEKQNSDSKTNEFLLYPIIPNDCDDNFSVNDMLTALRSEDYTEFSKILGSRNVDLYRTCEDDTLLHFCAKRGLLPAVHMLFTVGFSLEIMDKDRNTPLMVAVITFQNDVVKYLIKAGASITSKGMDSMTALHLAAQCGNLDACVVLVRRACNKHNYINTSDEGGWTALVWAAEYGYVDIVQYLLENGADPLRRDLKQNVALHWAAYKGSEKIINYILQYGGKPNDVNVQGDSPLHIAARQNEIDAVSALLFWRADINIVNEDGETALDCAEPDSECQRVLTLNAEMVPHVRYPKLPTVLTRDITNGREASPIACTNSVDDELQPSNFKYINECCVTSDIEIDKKITSLISCSCTINTCTTECICYQNSSCSYNKDGTLTETFNFTDPPLVFECNQMCSCNMSACFNRTVQRGVQCYFELFKTLNKGWGVKSVTAIPRGSFVCEYVGEIITDLEADQRDDDSYLFDLDDRETETFCIDAKRYGNFARFLNHSCSANLTPIKVFTDHQDLRFPRVAFFANRDISADEELCFDYGLKYWIVKGKLFTCECNSVDCRYSAETLHDTIERYQEHMQIVEDVD